MNGEAGSVSQKTGNKKPRSSFTARADPQIGAVLRTTLTMPVKFHNHCYKQNKKITPA
jgi:hypothetical protein